MFIFFKNYFLILTHQKYLKNNFKQKSISKFEKCSLNCIFNKYYKCIELVFYKIYQFFFKYSTGE